MHKTSKRRMGEHIAKYIPTSGQKVADLGSYEVGRKSGGTYRPLIEPGNLYTGIDLRPGKNVDMVMESAYRIPVEDNHFNHLISGQCFEHVKNPFKLMAEVARIVEPGGYVLIVAPSAWNPHRVPVDCWRILEDGWAALFDESGITLLETEYIPYRGNDHIDSWGVGRV